VLDGWFCVMYFMMSSLPMAATPLLLPADSSSRSNRPPLFVLEVEPLSTITFLVTDFFLSFTSFRTSSRVSVTLRDIGSNHEQH